MSLGDFLLGRLTMVDVEKLLQLSFRRSNIIPVMNRLNAFRRIQLIVLIDIV